MSGTAPDYKPKQRVAEPPSLLHASAPDSFALERKVIKHDQSGCGSFKCIDLDDVADRIGAWRQHVPTAQMMYGLSSEQDPTLLQALREQGMPFCVQSRTQLERLSILGAARESVSYSPAFPVGDAVVSLQASKPSTITIGSTAALQRLLGDHRSFQDAFGYAPRVHVLLRFGSGDQAQTEALAVRAYQNPEKVMELISVLKQAGVQSFGLSALVVNTNGASKPYAQAATALKLASSKMAQAGVSLESVQLLGGLCDSATVMRQTQRPLQKYLGELNAIITDLKASVCGQHSRHDIAVSVDAGQVLVGHVPILSRITNVVRRPGNPYPFVFIESTSYGDFAGHMYGGAAVTVAPVQDPSREGALSARKSLFVVQGGSCDSVDLINDVATGLPAQFMLPEDITTGCYLALSGPRIDNGGMDFNLIPTAKVVALKRSAASGDYLTVGASPPFAEKLNNLRKSWGQSADAQLVRSFVESFVRNKGSSAGISGEPQRRERIKRAATAVLSKFPDLKVPVVLLDLGEYVGRVRQVETFLRWLPRFRSQTEFKNWKESGCPRSTSPTGVDRLFIPLKTFNDPVAIAALSQLGQGYDAASSGEIAVAFGAGATLRKDVIVSHPHMTERTLLDVAAHSPWAVTVDCESQLDRLVQAGLSRDTVIFVRIKASAASAINDLGVKFGAPYSVTRNIDEVTPLVCKAHRAGFTNLGLAFHVGTQCFESGSYRDALARCVRITSLLASKNGIIVRNFNIGGGFSDERIARANQTSERKTLAQTGQHINAFREKIEQIVGGSIHIIAEPGRVTCAAAAATLIPVVEVCGEMTSIPRVRLGCNHQGILSGNVHDSAYYEFESLDYVAGARVFGGVDVLGVSGDARDRFAPAPGNQHKITTATKPGDWVVSFESGAAYGVNAAGAANGIDPGGVIAFYEDSESAEGFRFIKSPFFDIEGLKNRALYEEGV